MANDARKEKRHWNSSRIVRKNINRTALDARFVFGLPENIQKILAILAGNNLEVNGGIPRYVLLHLLHEAGEFNDEVRLEIERGIVDVDMALPRGESWARSGAWLESAGMAMQGKLAQIGVELEPKDVQFVNTGRFGDEAISKVLCSRDFPFNESLLVWEDGGWVLYFTQECREDLINGIGFLNPIPGLYWTVDGRIVPSPLGWARMIKYLVSGKIDKIILPEISKTLYFEEIGRRIAEVGDKRYPAGCNLGKYSLILMLLYCKDLAQQRRAMIVLNDLGFTDLLDPADYIREQKLLLQLSDKDIKLEKLTWQQVIERQAKRGEKIQKGRSELSDARDKCTHDMVFRRCKGCRKECSVGRCTKCTYAEFRSPLPCTAAVYEGRVLVEDGVENHIYVPPLPKLEAVEMAE